jgi:arsenate reductase (thioredoxin)
VKYVLFVCTHNAGRSQMAQAFFERYAPAEFRAESAGQSPSAIIWPNVVTAMQEVGIDISGRKPKKLDREMQLHADWGVTLNCDGECPYIAATVEDWDVPDPADQPLDVVREIRDRVEEHVRDFVDNRLEEVRADPTPHRLRLERLLPSLAEEFEGEKTPEEIRACADLILAEFDEVPVRSFVLTLAHRRTRDCLRENRCAALV